MGRWRILFLGLALAASSGCLSTKLNGFEEIAAHHQRGMEEATATDEGASLIRALGNYINELERQLESQ